MELIALVSLLAPLSAVCPAAETWKNHVKKDTRHSKKMAIHRIARSRVCWVVAMDQGDSSSKMMSHFLSYPFFPPVTPWKEHSFFDVKNLHLLPCLDEGG